MNILVVDRDSSYAKLIKTATDRAFVDVRTWHSTSVESAIDDFKAQLSANDDSEKNAALDAQAVYSAPAHADLDLWIESETGKVIRTANTLEFLGFEIARLKADPLLWKTLFDFEDRERFQKFLNSARTAARREDEFRIRDEAKNLYSSVVLIEPALDEGDVLKVSLSCKLSSSGQGENSGLHRPPSYIDMVIVSWEDLEAQALPFIKKFFADVEIHNNGGDFLKIVSAYDQTHFEMKTILAAQITDILFKPFDELLFLQKTLIQSPSLKTSDSGSFLYTARAPLSLELCGEYSITGISETGFEIKHRGPIAQGKKLKLYSDIFGAPGKNGLFATCYSTVPNADETHFISEFSFFGLSLEQIKYFRELLTPHRKIQTESEKKSNFRQIRARPPSLENQGRRKIALIDFDRDTEDALRQLIERNMQNFELEVVGSYDKFMRGLNPWYSSGEVGALSVPSNANEWETETAFQPVTLVLTAGAMTLRGIEPVSENAVIAGHALRNLQGQVDGWWKVIHSADRAHVKELLTYAAYGKEASIDIRIVNHEGRVHFVKAIAKLEVAADARLIKLELTDQTPIALGLSRPVVVEDDSFSESEIVAVVLDLAFIAQRPDEILGGLAQALARATGSNKTPIFLLSESVKTAELLQKNILPVVDVFPKPVDRNYFMRKVRHSVLHSLDEESAYAVDAFMPVDAWLDIAKPIAAEGIGEYGLEVVHSAAVPVGAWGHFYHPALLNDEGRGVIGRCIRSEPTESGKFKMVFLFLGIQEEMLKQIRLFIKRFSISRSGSFKA